MDLKLLKCDWGMEYLGDQRARLAKFAAAGWDGIECATVEIDPAEFGDLCGELDLDYVAMMFCDDEQAFRDQLERIKRTRPILINCHPGRDRYDFARGLEFFRNVMEMAGEVDVPVVFETHRTRLLYAPWTTARYLEAIPELRITANQDLLLCGLDDFGADDAASMAANNTSAFNCRAIDGHPGVWSEHSYGWAVDINPVQNPWVRGIQVDPPAGVPYADRAVQAPGMIYGGPVVHGGKVYVATCNLEGPLARQPTVVVCIGAE
jgi:hypothetical protein